MKIGNRTLGYMKQPANSVNTRLRGDINYNIGPVYMIPLTQVLKEVTVYDLGKMCNF